MSIIDSTRRFETWLGRYTPLVARDIREKHQKMADDPFTFLRATFYRWLDQWPHVCPELQGAPPVLAVGDLHVENFGTWRDREGRLIWGVNDVDDACMLPYAQDLVRLTASAFLALHEGHLKMPRRDVCGAVLDGYQSALAKGGRPIVLAERHGWLREIAVKELRDPAGFWERVQEPAKGRDASGAPRELLRAALPKPAKGQTIIPRSGGVGSLGRRRFAIIANAGGSLVAREAKALVPSALAFLTGNADPPLARARLLDNAVRVADPFLSFEKGWAVRRLAPDCLKIEIADFPKAAAERKLLRAMGWETANLHLATGTAARLRKDLESRPERWLQEAATAMVNEVRTDFDLWRRR